MADIAPLGFAVDTKALADAAAVAKDTEVKILGIADAADKVAEASDKSAVKVKRASDAHKDTAKAVDQHTASLDNLKKKTEEVGNAADTQSQRIHAMVEQSLARLDQQYTKAQQVLDLASSPKTSPRDPGSQQFERQVEATAYKNMGPTDADIARQQKATKETEAFRKEMERLTGVVDPAQAKIMRLDGIVEQLGKKFDAGLISQKQYNDYLDKIEQQEQRLNNPVQRRDTHHSFLGEAGRTLTYGIPRFGREARRLVYEAESEQPGGGLGAGLGGFAKLAGGAAVGMLAVDAFRYIAALPKQIAEANDEAEKLERRLSSFDIGGITKARDVADQLHISVKGAADAMVEFHNAFTRFAADQPSQDAVFAAAVAAGRIGGLDEKGQTQSAVQLASLSNKAQVSGSDINSLQSSNPVLAKEVAGRFGTDVAGLQTLAATGQVSGQALYNAVYSINQRLRDENAKIPANAKELQQQAKNASDKMLAAVSDHVDGMFYRLGAKISSGLANMFNGPDATPGNIAGVAVALPPVHPGNDAVAKALTLGEKYNSYSTGRQELSSNLSLVNDAIKSGAGGAALDNLRAIKREIEAQLQEADTPFSRINDQVQQLTEAFGHGGGNSGLIGVWEQALQIQKEQQRTGHGVAGSLQEIVDKLLEVKRAQQAIADTDALKGLQQSIDSTAAKRGSIGIGGYEQQVRAFRVQQQYEDRAHNELYGATGGGAASSAPSAGGSASFSAFVNALAMQESGNRDYDRNGRPVRSNQGALYGMQVLPSTAARPGFGIAAASSQSASEYDRVGIQLARALYDHFGGDVGKAAGAYHSGLGGVGNLGPKGRAYVASIMRRLGISGGAAGVGGASGGLNAYPAKRTAEESNFFSGIDLQSATSLGALVGDPDAFMNGGVISGGSIGNAGQQAAALRGGADEGTVHRLQLEQQIAEEVKGLAPKYRDAYAEAKRLDDAGQQRLKTEQTIAQLTQDAADNARRAVVAQTGEPSAKAALELQLSIDKIKRQHLPGDEEARQIGAQQADARGSSLLAVGDTLGSLNDETRTLKDQLTLTRSSTQEMAVQQKIIQARNDIEDHSLGLTKDEITLRENEAEAIIRGNDLLAKRLDLINSLKGSFTFAIDTIGSAWSNMFADFERHGKLHVSVLLRGIEDGFYGMLDRIEQKLVISPLMNVLDKLFTNLLSSAFPNVNGGGGGGSSFGASGKPGAAGATGMVFGPGGLMPYTNGGVLNTPTRFAFANGGIGLGGEGPGLYEGLLPLKRGADGRLGVSAHGMNGGGGGGGVQVVINDHRGSSAAPVEVQEREGGDGQRSLEITLRDNQRANIAGGRVDADMRGAYGISRPAVRR